MSEWNNTVRKVIEGIFDKALSKPLEEYEIKSKQLATIGIEPNLETILSYISGMIIGSVLTYTVTEEYDKEKRNEIMKSTRELLERRAWELREAFSRARYT